MSTLDNPPPTPQILARDGAVDSRAPKSTTRLGDALIRMSDLVYYIRCEADAMWYWNLRRKDESVVAQGARGYITRSDCRDSIMLTRTSQHAAIVEE